MKNFVIVIKRLDEEPRIQREKHPALEGKIAPRYQAQIREFLLGNAICYSRREDRASKAKRAIDQLFGPREWVEPPDSLLAREPDITAVAHVRATIEAVEAGRKGGLSRRNNLTADERSEAARKAVEARWNKEKS